MGKLKKLKKFVPPHDPLWTDGRASTEQALGINRTSLGHQQNKPWAHTANTAGNECPIIRFILGTIISISNKHSKKT